jgi:hypothetical protein
MDLNNPGANELFMMLNAYPRGGVIYSAKLAVKLAELVLEDVEGAFAVERSRPFSAEDLGEAWHVRANPAATGEEGETPWEIIIQKLDAKILVFGRSKPMTITKEMLQPGGEGGKP